MSLSKEYEIRRQEAWLEAWCATARADNCIKESSCTRFADRCLKDFDERFKPDPDLDQEYFEANPE